MKGRYQGYRNWNHWNVALWINNDQELYNMALECIRQSRFSMERMRLEVSVKDYAAKIFVDLMKESGNPKTPDGAPYSFSSVRAAMGDM